MTQLHAVMQSEKNDIHSGFNGIAVIGLGLIGASIAAAIKEVFPKQLIFGVDTNTDTCKEACRLGLIDEAVLPSDERFHTFIDSLCDLIVICVPPDVVPDYFSLLSEWNYFGIITDTASTKSSIVSAAATELLNPECYIPGHPMSGAEVNGISGARSDLFKGAHWILCPDEHSSPDAFARLHDLLCHIGARVISLPRENHDDAVAIVSHVPHFIAASLMLLASRHSDESKSLMRLAAGGFKDTTRIAAGSPDLWCSIAFDNCDALRDGLYEMLEIVSSFITSLETKNLTALTELLDQAAQARRALPQAWVPSTDKLLEVRIPMEDKTGVVAQATTIASSVGCNIQSIEIDHITEDTAVLSLILTDEGDIGRLSSKLISSGFAVSFRPLIH